MSISGRMNKLQHIHILEYFMTMKRNKALIYVTSLKTLLC